MKNIISRVIDIIEKTQEIDYDILINELSEFMKNSINIAGDENDIHRNLSLKLENAKNCAEIDYSQQLYSKGGP